MAAGWLVAGTAGAAGGATFGPLVKAVAQDVSMRWLSEREMVRVGAALTYAVEMAQNYERAGKKPRTDGFFTKPVSGRSAGEEIAEGVLLAAQKEHEENKVRHQGYMLATIGYVGSIDRVSANWLIRTSNELSWNQYVLLSLAGDDERRQKMPSLSPGTYSKKWETWAARQDMADLGWGARGLIYGKPTEEEARIEEEERAESKFLSDLPSKVIDTMSQQHLGSGGLLLYQALHLEEVRPTSQLLTIDVISDKAPTALD